MATEDVIRAAIADATAVPEAEAPVVVDDTKTDAEIEEAAAVADEKPEGDGEVKPEGEIKPEGDDAAAAAAALAEKDAKEKAEKEKPAEEDPFAKEHGIKSKMKDGRDNRIPYSIVSQRIVPNAVKKALEPLQTELNTLKESHAGVTREVEGWRNVERVLYSNPEQYLQILSNVKDRQGNFIYRDLLANRGRALEAKPEAHATDAPPPDVKDKDGNPVGYSPDGLKALLKWNRDEAKREALVEAEQKFNERLTPFERAEQERRAAAAEEGMHRQLADQYQTAVKTWDGFEANQDAILKALQDDSAKAEREGRIPTLTLEGAYRQIVFPKMKTDRETLEKELTPKIREQVLAEIKKAQPKNTSVNGALPSGAKKEVENKDDKTPRATTDIIKEAIAASGLK